MIVNMSNSQHIDMLSQFASQKKITKYISLTAEEARMLLEQSLAKRPIRRLDQANVKKLCRIQLTDGLWEPKEYEPLKFRKDGTILSAQHRLAAQVMSGKTIAWKIQLGCDEDDEKRVNAPNKPNNTADFLVERSYYDKTLSKVTKGGNQKRAADAAKLAKSIYSDLVSEENPINEDIERIVKHFCNEIIWALNHCNGRNVTKAAVQVSFVYAIRYARRNGYDTDYLSSLVTNIKSRSKADLPGSGGALRRYLTAVQDKKFLREKAKANKSSMPMYQLEAIIDGTAIIQRKTMYALQVLACDESIRDLVIKKSTPSSQELVEWHLECTTSDMRKKLKLSTLHELKSSGREKDQILRIVE